MNSFLETGVLRDNAFAEKFVLTQSKISTRDKQQRLGKCCLPNISIYFSIVDFDEPFDTKKNTQYEDLNSIRYKFNEDQS